MAESCAAIVECSEACAVLHTICGSLIDISTDFKPLFFIAMSFTNPLIEYFELRTTSIRDGHIEHIIQEDDEDRIAIWHRVKHLGDGGGSEAVWLERRENVDDGEELRAVKQIRSSRDLKNKVRRSRELLAMVTFKGVINRTASESFMADEGFRDVLCSSLDGSRALTTYTLRCNTFQKETWRVI